jgi:predicted RNA-binding Zn-ribbon protein involved in translation (DUF1610 family)
MECPHCGYQDGWNGELNKDIKGEKGSFYRLSNNIEMERDATSWMKEEIHVYGCPECFKLFMKNNPY